jgi:hypothetical protein
MANGQILHSEQDLQKGERGLWLLSHRHLPPQKRPHINRDILIIVSVSRALEGNFEL